MSKQGAALAMGLGLTLAGAACSHPEKGVIDNYFGAVNKRDTQTLSSFAEVDFGKKVDNWKITQTHSEKTEPAPLPDLVKKVQELEAALAENKKAAGAYNNGHYSEIDQVRELRKKSKPVPAKLSAVAAEWDKFNDNDRKLKRAVADAKAAVEKEKRAVTMSVGDVQDLETIPGDVLIKQVTLDLTVGGQPQKYVMTLRKYALKAPSGTRVVSRWVVHELTPAG